MAIRNIVIVGGGTAGWMAAAALSRLKQSGLVEVTLVESEAIGTVGVGEATIPPFVEFNQILDIDERQMLSEIQGTFKLGIQFVNWGNQGDSYFHPFGNYGYEIEGMHFHQVWHKYRQSGDPRPLHAYSPETMAASHRKFMRTDGMQRDDLPPINYAYHLDAGRYAKFLRTYAEKRGVVRKEGKVTDVRQDPESGYVTSIAIDDGTELSGDFFVDCSGFRGLLIEQALETGYEEWTHWLPCNRAVAIPSARKGAPLPYTRATAHAAGWQWQVPLQHRNGNGHVYCDAYMEQDEATEILLANIDGEPMADPNHLRFVTGKRKKFWNKNVVAIGLSAGFMEPLESTSIHLINTAINKLVSLLSLDGITQAQEDAFNRLTMKEYVRIRDFLILHYKATERTDSEFWNYCRTMDVPDSLKEKIDLFRLNGQIFREEDELFTATSWVAVMLGQGIVPEGHNPMADTVAEPGTQKEMAEIEKSIQYLVKQMPSHEEFLRKYCPAKAA
ncbi:tryptophan halogenase family protein [Parerythrobacter jejuensis]|uniref:Tryptophan halogenase n=1 Tax=Parerythrobacter jejuensis TaxID=795812 RepID=A0A845AT25_9SPHN|nr:tryptophan halogenase family protein [Parerythrobacter jejuensis]MXP31991.1 tryptophan halogenase [Parerythrobacter jejuensis]